MNVEHESEIIQYYEETLKMVEELRFVLPKLIADHRQFSEVLNKLENRHGALSGLLVEHKSPDTDREPFHTYSRENTSPKPSRRAKSRRPRIRRWRNGLKPKVQVIEEILKQRGPLHVTDIVAAAEERAMPFTGKKPKTLQVRDMVYRSKRFHNLGNNVWALVGQNAENSHVQAQAPLIRIG